MTGSSTPGCHQTEPLPLGSDEVHILYASVEGEAAWVKTLFEYLDEAERERAERFHFPKDRTRFIVARGVLRAILSRYLSLGPEQLCFTYNSYGKPALKRDSSRRDLRFNISHTGDLIIYVISPEREVGVDVERVRGDLDFLNIAQRFFANKEVSRLSSLAAELQLRGFFNCWTRKEAYIKARGQGLSLPLNQFEVSCAPDEPARLLSTAHDDDDVTRWSLQELSLGHRYAAAIAVEGAGWQAKHYRWTGWSLWPLEPEKVEAAAAGCWA